MNHFASFRLYVVFTVWATIAVAKPMAKTKPFSLSKDLLEKIFARDWNSVDNFDSGYTTRRSYTLSSPGNIESPNYPNKYPSDVEYQWKIVAPAGYRIRLTFLAFNVENDPQCVYDKLEIYEGPSKSSALNGQYCGHFLPSVVNLPRNEALLVFTSDAANNDWGFKIQVQFLGSSGGLTTYRTPTTTTRTTTTTTRNTPTKQSNSLPIPPRCGKSKYTRAHATKRVLGEHPPSEGKWQWKRILGGQPSRQGEWPWIAILMTSSGSAQCGGSLINQNWVLTAAHCFEVDKKLRLADPSYWTLRLGEHDLTNNDGRHVDIKAKKVIIHPQRNANTQEYDFALMELERPAQLNDYINVVCLPSQDDTFSVGQTCVTAGWGSTDAEGTKFPSVIRKLNIPLLSRERCKQLLGSNSLTSDMFCAGHVSGGKDTCGGDSGGPLVCQKQGQYVLHGVVSWGFGCGVSGYPGIYGDVQKALPWIEKNTGNK